VALIDSADAQAWAEGTKVDASELDDELLSQIEAEILGIAGLTYDVSVWEAPASTPTLIKKIIAMNYVAAIYDRTYSEDGGLSEYAALLRAQASVLLTAISNHTVELGVEFEPILTGSPSFYPTDASSAQAANTDDMSLGGPVFSMGTTW
jgi:hypothetical protein